MVLGVLLGLIPIPIPGVGVVTLGIGGGPLIVALILGKLRRTGPMLWVMPLPANHRASELRAGDVSGAGRHQRRPAICAHGFGNRADHAVYRRRRPADDRAHRACWWGTI